MGRSKWLILVCFVVVGVVGLYATEFNSRTVTPAGSAKDIHLPLVTDGHEAAVQPGSKDVERKPAYEPGFVHPSATDFYTLAVRAAESRDAREKFEGHAVARECIGIVKDQELFAFEAGATNTNIRGVLTPERQKAISSLKSRCQGFFTAGITKTRELINELDLDGRKDSRAAFHLNVATGRPAPNGVLIDIVQHGGMWALNAAEPELAAKWIYFAGIGKNAAERTLAEIGAMFALCDLGKDCSADSFGANLECAYRGMCGKSLDEVADFNLTDEEAKKVAIYRNRFAEIIKSKNLGALGLSTP